MIEKNYSVTRSKATWKPRVVETDISFFHCEKCGSIFQGVSDSRAATHETKERSSLACLPYQRLSSIPVCCYMEMKQIPLIERKDLPESIKLDYQIVGGFNNNAISLIWEFSSKEFSLEWATLKTYTGIQTKYVLPQKGPKLIFALADEDAYGYCDEDPCLKCVFACKRGFVLYAFVKNFGLVKITLADINPS